MKEFIKEGIEKDRHRGLMESELIGRVHAAFTGEFGAIFESLERILVSLMFLLVNLEGILVSDAFTREFGGNTRETQKRICLFPLLCTMNVVFKEEFVVLTRQLKMILVLTVLGSIVKAAKQLFNSIVRAIKNNGNICHESSEFEEALVPAQSTVFSFQFS